MSDFTVFPMPKYIAIFATKRPLTPVEYPSLFGFFEAIHRGARFCDRVVAFLHDGDHNAAYEALREHLDDDDELFVFRLAAARWTVADPAIDQQLRDFLES